MLDLTELDVARIRWQAGHHLFFSLVQSLIIACDRLQRQVEGGAGNLEAAAIEIDRATRLMWGIATVFKLTGSFGQAAYEGYVRPNMFEAAEGFSGLWAQDHDFLVKRIMRSLKPIFADPPPELAEACQQFRQAFAVMYDSHKYVCERFEGQAPSLLMGEDSQKSAGEMIETFKRNRLLVLGVSPGGAA